MRQADCTHTIRHGHGLSVEQRTLARLWLVWLAGTVARLPDQLLLWFDRARQRRHLSQLDDRMLRDIGISRGAAWSEARKHFWQV